MIVATEGRVLSTARTIIDERRMLKADKVLIEMADGLNEARALRVLEIMNDFRTLQLHISAQLQRTQSRPPDAEAANEQGYILLRQCNAAAQAVLSSNFSPGSLGIQGGQVNEGEVEKATLQRVILDASTRRLQAHRIYLRCTAGVRWAVRRAQILGGQRPGNQHAAALQRNNEILRDELSEMSDLSILRDLRRSDRSAGHWIDEDPDIERIQAWLRHQQSRS